MTQRRAAHETALAVRWPRPNSTGGARTAVLAALASLCLCVSARAAADPSLVAYYTFDEGPGAAVKDSSGKGNDGKNMGAEYVRMPSGNGFALSFDAPSAYVDCGSGTSFDFTGPFSIELWLFPQARPVKGEAGVIGKGYDSYLLSYTGGCWFYLTTAANGGTDRTDCFGRAAPAGWRHLVATFDGETASLYSDGKLCNSGKTTSPTVNSVKGSLYLRYPVVWGDEVVPSFKCMMDEVRIYSRALSEEEIVRHHNEEVKDREDVSWTEAVQLDYRVLADTATLVVEADFSRMTMPPAGLGSGLDWNLAASAVSPRPGLRPAEAVLRLELREPNGGKVVARHEAAGLSPSGTADCLMSVEDLPPGEYELRAEIVDADVRIGVPSAAKVELSKADLAKPGWAAAYDEVKVLNNFAAELLAVRSAPQQPQETYEFRNPRNGWVFVSSTATAHGTDRVSVSLDSAAAEDAVILHTRESEETLEAMRYVPAGTHKLYVRCEGTARPAQLVVRAIPLIIPVEVGYWRAPIVPAYGPYTWEFLDRIGLLDNGNAIIEREPRPENAEHLADWRRQGKKILAYYNVTWLTRKHDPVTTDAVVAEWSGPSSRGLRSPDYDGIVVDEWASSITFEQYTCFAEAIQRIAADPTFLGKAIHPYGGGRFNRERAKPAATACMDAGYKLAENMYIAEQPTEQAARDRLNALLTRNMLLYREAFPDENVARHMIMNLGFMSGPPESSDACPDVNYKVFLDMQMNLLANDPMFFGLYGFQWYHIGYVDEEILRWGTKLLRHYCIEGKKERLSSDPYLLPHIANGDFDLGAAGWTVTGAEAGSVAIRQAPGYGFLQGRFSGGGTGDRVLVTKRSDTAPNRISQTVRELTPGRAYSVTMFVTDYGEYRKGSSVDRPHPFAVRIDGTEPVAKGSFRVVFGSGLCGHEYGPFDRVNQLYITYYRDVFRARSATAQLTISDWVSDDAPGGPIGQELGFNFTQVQPYLEE